MKKHLILAFLLSAFVLACDEGIYPDFMKDDSSDAAAAEEMELALNNREYDKIIGWFDPEDDLSSVQYLSDRQKYILQCAYMGKAGFDPIANLDLILDDSTDVDPMSALLGSQGTISRVDAATNSNLYGKAANIHLDYNKDNYYVDEDIMLAGSVASALRMVMGFTGAGSALCDNLDFEDKPAVQACVNSATPDPGMIYDSLEIMRGLVSDDNLDGKVKEKIQEILDEIAASTGSDDYDKVKDYLANSVFA